MEMSLRNERPSSVRYTPDCFTSMSPHLRRIPMICLTLPSPIPSISASLPRLTMPSRERMWST